MKLRAIPALIAFVGLLASCDKENFEPFACLEVDNIYPTVGELITFTDCSEDAYRIEIDFGDGTLSRSEIIQHSYAEEGEYNVELKAWNKNGKKRSASRFTIYVGGAGSGGTGGNNIPPWACFIPSDTASEVGVEIDFFNCSLNGLEYLWDFGDGNTSTAVLPSHIFTASGSYDVVLTATNGSLSDDTTIIVTIGQRVLTTITLNSFPDTDPNGEEWDPQFIPIFPTDPDIMIAIESDGGSLLETDIADDISSDDLPFVWDHSSDNFILETDDWAVTIIDDEGFQGPPTTMTEWTTTDLGSDGSNGQVVLSSGSYNLVIGYSVQ